MKKITLLASIITTVVALEACHSNEPQAPQAEAQVAVNPNDSLFTVNEAGYNFQIALPKDLMIANAPEIAVNEATGELNIRLGEQFWIVATQEQMDLASIKHELEEDMLFTNKVVEESNNSLLVQRILPDGTTYDYSYQSLNQISGKPYVFKTSEEGEFSMESVNRMRQAISTVHQKA
jgi:hypothetical protein